MTEHNKRKVELFVEAVWNRGQLGLIDELVADDHLGRLSWLEKPVAGPEGVRRLVSSHRRAYPDLYIKIDDQIAEDDLVALRWRAFATTLEDNGPTGRSRFWTGLSLIRLLAGRQVDAYTIVVPTTIRAVQMGPDLRTSR